MLLVVFLTPSSWIGSLTNHWFITSYVVAHMQDALSQSLEGYRHPLVLGQHRQLVIPYIKQHCCSLNDGRPGRPRHRPHLRQHHRPKCNHWGPDRRHLLTTTNCHITSSSTPTSTSTANTTPPRLKPFRKHAFSTLTNIPVKLNLDGWYEFDTSRYADEAHSQHKKNYYQLNHNPNQRHDEPDTQVHSKLAIQTLGQQI